MPVNIPILLTWLRIVLDSPEIGIYYFPDAWIFGINRDVAAMLVFVIAGVTDWLPMAISRVAERDIRFRRVSRPGR